MDKWSIDCQSLMEVMDDCSVILLDVQGQIVDCNKATELVFGFNNQELKGCNFNLIFGTEDLTAGLPSRLLQEVSSSNRIKHNVWRTRKDGSLVWVNEVISTNFNSNNQLNGYIVIIKNLSITKATENTFGQANSNLKGIIESVSDSLLLVDRHGVVLAFNTRAFSVSKVFFGSELQVGINIFDYITDDRKVYVRMLLDKASRGEKVEYEQYFINKDHKEVWYENSAHAVFENGVLEGYCLKGKEITDRKVTEKKLQINEKRYRSIVENGIGALVIFSPEGVISYVSPSVKKMMGFTPDEIYKDNFLSFVHPEDQPGKIKLIGELMSQPGISIHSTPTRVKHKNGSWLWFDCTFTNMLHDPDINGIVDNFYDITEAVNRDNELKRQKEQLQKIMDNSIDVICTFDVHGNFLSASPSSFTHWGYKPEELIGNFFGDYVLPADLPKTLAGFSNLMDDIQSPNFENRVIRKDGGIATNYWLARWNKDEGVVYGFARDASDRKKLELALESERRRLNDLFNQIPAAMCILQGEDHIFTMANPQYLDVTNKKDIIGKKAFDVFPEVASQGFLALVNNVYRTGIPFKGDEVLIQVDRDGNGVLTDIYVNFVYEPLIDDTGKIDGVFFFACTVTEQVLARRQIEANERYFRALVENAADLITLNDASGLITYSSPAIIKLLGYTVDEMIGKHFASFLVPDQMEKSYDYFMKLMQNPGIPILHEACFVHKNGHIVWMEGTGINLLGDENVNAIVANHREITERKMAEEKMLYANRLYAFISSINHAISHTRGRDVLLNEACRIAVEIGKFKMAWIGFYNKDSHIMRLVANAGIPENELHTFSAFEYRSEGAQGKVEVTGKYFVSNDIENDVMSDKWRDIFRRLGIHSCVLLPLTKSGVTIGSLSMYSEEKNFFDENEIALLLEIVVDISFALEVFEKDEKRELVSRQLQHSELRLKEAQAIAHVGSFEINLNSGKILWSEEACRIYGLPVTDNVQNIVKWLSYQHPEDRDMTLNILKDSMETMSSTSFNHRILRPDGSMRYVSTQTQIVLSENGEPEIITGVAQDVTEQKLLEIERAKMISDLIQRNKDLEQFSYIISHNLRSPVANIKGLVEMLDSDHLTDQESKLFREKLAFSVQKMDGIINDLNEVLQVKNNLEGHSELVKFNEIIDDIKISISSYLQEEEVQIITDFTEINEMMTLKGYLHSIFYNLISNSVKYRRPGVKPVIFISTHVLGDKFHIVFRDNGLGIDLSKKELQIFGLYKRFHKHIQGKGMGLFMVKTQVETLGGRISVSSEVNKWTEFVIVFNLN